MPSLCKLLDILNQLSSLKIKKNKKETMKNKKISLEKEGAWSLMQSVWSWVVVLFGKL